MRIAIIADIHGNVPALEAVLADLAQQDVAETIVAGDLVNRGPEGAAVLARLVPRNWRTLMGNHEDLVLQFMDGRADQQWFADPWWASTRFVVDEVGSAWRSYMAALPPQLVVHPEGTTPIRVVHGSPRHFMEGMSPITPPNQLDEMLEQVSESLVVCAHTHFPMVRTHHDRVIVNTGAVGLPFNRDPRAQYALFDWDGAAWQVSLRQVTYDRAALEQAYEQTGFLSAGGISAWLLREEVRSASPHLVPFWKFCTTTQRPLDFSSLDDFMQERERLGY